jgi:hypothetical protein
LPWGSLLPLRLGRRGGGEDGDGADCTAFDASVKPRLVKPLVRSSGGWLNELPAVLWSLRTTPNRSTGFTPFFLVYGAKAIIPTDVEFDSPQEFGTVLLGVGPHQGGGINRL